MSNKRHAGQIGPSQMVEIANRIIAASPPPNAAAATATTATTTPTTTFTDGAIEGLRVSHHRFVQRLAEELAKQDTTWVVEQRIVDAMNAMGMPELAQEALRRSEKAPKIEVNEKKKRRMKPVKKKWTKEMEVEQEKLFAQSKEAMERAQRSGK
mmetsp:Transcript_5463/g.8992  ORF Transcript_5463/g.8992 Transcript_5463/m.8992 type:complete len:154 (-) Transcript_5463:423-884(-)|eukprot:CAMPEP_0119006116 /NCGR_PEP_ID=MMETSP1176-20130426/2120_1 /TAXON_ID=265551 /ORGANISM="Synedropsis recta cf, Strain CCMP1620" /LENGTH=153 /DNA_ID=CAMNT_0006958003 /DNA_START=86 /DNA_END=547 /DNA_ORIENTATION=+